MKQKTVMYLEIFLRNQQKQLLDLQRHFDKYVDTLPVFGFNSGKYDLNLVKAYLIPHLLNDRTIQSTEIKKANQFISFKYGDIQFLDILNILGGAASLDSFLKAYQSEETKSYFQYEWFDSSTKHNSNHLPPYDSFFSKLKNLNPLEKDFCQFKKLTESGKEELDDLRVLGLKERPLSVKENYALLEELWRMEKMKTFRDFLRWYNNKTLFKEEFRCTEMLCLCSKTCCCYNSERTKTKFSSKGLNKSVLEENSDGPLQKYSRVLDDAVNIASTNRGFKTKNHQILTFEQTKKDSRFSIQNELWVQMEFIRHL